MVLPEPVGPVTRIKPCGASTAALNAWKVSELLDDAINQAEKATGPRVHHHGDRLFTLPTVEATCNKGIQKFAPSFQLFAARILGDDLSLVSRSFCRGDAHCCRSLTDTN